MEHVDLSPWFKAALEIDPGTPLDWRTFWGNDHPVELDIGAGRGLFLRTAAAARPDINFLGIELDFKEGRRAARGVQKLGLTNARVLGGDVHWVLRHLIAPASIAGVHVYFPDPWWKHRHRKRRVFNDQFVDACLRALQPGSLFHSWTDVPEYFEVIRGLMDHHPGFETLPPPQEREPAHHMDYHTSFERKARLAGVKIHRGLWRKR